MIKSLRPTAALDVLSVRIRDAVAIDRRIAWLVAIGTIVGAAALVGYAARTGQLERAAEIGALALVILLCLGSPFLPLYVFVGLIPVEAVGTFGDLGTLSRYAGIAFAIAYAFPRIGRLVVPAIPAPGWLFAGWALLSITWAIDPAVAATSLSTFIQLFLIAFLVADVVVHRPSMVRPLLWIYSVSAAFTGVIGIDAYITGQTDAGRAAAFAAQDVAQFAALLLPALVFSLSELLRGRRPLLSAIVATICTMGIVVSGTRGAWLSAVVVVAIFMLPRLKASARIASISVIVTLLLVALQLPGVADLITQRTATAVSTGGAGRTDIWTVALSIIETSPVVGVGYGNFPVAFTPDLISNADVGVYLANDESAKGPHSLVFGTTAELGIVGLITVVLFLGPLVLRRGWGPEGWVVQAALASLLVSALFLDELNRKQLWLIVGMASGLGYLAARERATMARRARPRSRRSSRAIGRPAEPAWPDHVDLDRSPWVRAPAND